MLKKQDLGINPYVANNGSRDQYVVYLKRVEEFLELDNAICLSVLRMPKPKSETTDRRE